MVVGGDGGGGTGCFTGRWDSADASKRKKGAFHSGSGISRAQAEVPGWVELSTDLWGCDWEPIFVPAFPSRCLLKNNLPYSSWPAFLIA